MSTKRITVADLAARLDAHMEAQAAHNAAVTAILASLTDTAPAVVTAKPSPAKKAAPKRTRKAAPKAKPATKGSQTRETLSRKDFNRTVTAKARLRGGSAYATVVANWAVVSDARDAGMTPDEVLSHLLG